MRPSLCSRIGAPALALALLAGVACFSPVPHYEFKYAEKRSVLPNGLRMVILPDDSTNLVQVDIRYDVGANEDPPGKAGLAHLGEHVMFQHRIFGEDKPTIFDVLPQLAVFSNAFTNWDTTHYLLQGRKEDLESLINLEAARMAAPCRAIPEAEFEREREVVRNEIRQRVGTPEGQIPQLILAAVYPPHHPYAQMIGGNDEQLASITLEDVCKFLDAYYLPQNATIIVAGDVDFEDVGKKISYAFGAIDKGLGADATPRPVGKRPVPPVTIESRKVVHALDVERSSVHVAWALPPHTDPNFQYARFVMSSVAGRVQSFASDWDFASSVQAMELGGALAPVLVLSVELKPGKAVDEALELVWKAVGNAHRYYEDGMFKQAATLFKARFIQELEPLTARTLFLGDLIQFDRELDWSSDQTYLIRELMKLDKLDGAKARAFVKATLKRDHAAVVVIEAEQGGRRGDARADLKFDTSTEGVHHERKPIVDPAEAKRPLPVPEVDSAVAAATRFQLDNGMNVVMLPFAKLPIVRMMLMFRAGAAQEPADLPGLASVAAGFLDHPRGSQIGIIGASWGGAVDDDYSAFTVSGIDIYLAAMVEGLERRLKIGGYDQEVIEAWVKSRKDAFQLKSVRQQDAFRRAFSTAMWGPTHPYASKGSPTPESVGKLGQDEATAFRDEHYTAANATLIIAGKFDPVVAEAAVRAHFGGWRRGRVDAPVIEPAVVREAPTAIGVIGDEGPQVQIAIGYPAPAGIDAEQPARLVLAEMLSGLAGEIRTELGATYGLFAGRQTKLGPSIYHMGGGVDAQRAGESLRAIRAKLARLRAGEGFDLDFARARRVVLQRLLGQSTESAAVASRLLQIALYGLAPDYHEKLVRYVATVTPAQVRALIERELRPEREVLVVLGDKATLARTFAEAGIAAVEYVDVTQ